MPKAGGQLPGPVTVESCHKSHALPVLTITVRIHRHIFFLPPLNLAQQNIIIIKYHIINFIIYKNAPYRVKQSVLKKFLPHLLIH